MLVFASILRLPAPAIRVAGGEVSDNCGLFAMGLGNHVPKAKLKSITHSGKYKEIVKTLIELGNSGVGLEGHKCTRYAKRLLG